MKLLSSLKSDNYQTSFDVIVSGTLLVMTSFVFSFGITWNDPLSQKIAIVLALALGLAAFFKTVRLDLWMDMKETILVALWTGINLGMLMFTNVIVKQTFPAVNSAVAIDPTALMLIGKSSAAFVGVAEEMLFSTFAYPYFFRVFGGFVIPVFVLIMVFFMVFHFFVYGGDLLTLVVVAFSRGILTASVWQTKKVTPAILAHAGWNFLVA